MSARKVQDIVRGREVRPMTAPRRASFMAALQNPQIHAVEATQPSSAAVPRRELRP